MAFDNFNFVLVLVLFLIISLPYRLINQSLLISPISMSILTFVISLFTVIELNKKGIINPEVFNLITLVFFIFLIALVISPFLVKKRFLQVSSFINIRKFDIQITDWLFYANVVVSVVYIALLWGTYSEGSDRLLLNKDFRALSLINTLIGNWSVAMVSLVYATSRNKKYIFYFICIIFLSASQGSKGAAIVNLFIFTFFYLQFNSFTIKQKVWGFIILFLVIVLPTQLMYGNALNEILFRVAMSGDVYLLSFVGGDYTKLTGLYDPFLYIIHPLSSLIGIRGYDFPFGAQLLATPVLCQK